MSNEKNVNVSKLRVYALLSLLKEVIEINTGEVIIVGGKNLILPINAKLCYLDHPERDPTWVVFDSFSEKADITNSKSISPLKPAYIDFVPLDLIKVKPQKVKDIDPFSRTYNGRKKRF